MLGCLPVCPVHPKPQRDILYAVAASIEVYPCAKRAVQAKPSGYKPKQPSFAAEMAASDLIATANIQVDTQYLIVDANARPVKQIRNKHALELLCHGGLAAERLGLDLGSEGEEFYAGIQRLSGPDPKHVFIVIQRQHSPCAESRGTGRAQRHRARASQEQGSSPQGESLSAGDGFHLRTDLQRSWPDLAIVPVLWGKTLTHIAQECRQLVAEVIASHPECEIDVVCWWLGNEVCGDYGSPSS